MILAAQEYKHHKWGVVRGDNSVPFSLGGSVDPITDITDITVKSDVKPNSLTHLDSQKK